VPANAHRHHLDRVMQPLQNCAKRFAHLAIAQRVGLRVPTYWDRTGGLPESVRDRPIVISPSWPPAWPHPVPRFHAGADGLRPSNRSGRKTASLSLERAGTSTPAPSKAGHPGFRRSPPPVRHRAGKAEWWRAPIVTPPALATLSLSVSFQAVTSDLSCCHRPGDNTARFSVLRAGAPSHMVIGGHGAGRDRFGPFNWHNLAFDPFKPSQPAGQRAMRESLCGVVV